MEATEFVSRIGVEEVAEKLDEFWKHVNAKMAEVLEDGGEDDELLDVRDTADELSLYMGDLGEAMSRLDHNASFLDKNRYNHIVDQIRHVWRGVQNEYNEMRGLLEGMNDDHRKLIEDEAEAAVSGLSRYINGKPKADFDEYRKRHEAIS